MSYLFLVSPDVVGTGSIIFYIARTFLIGHTKTQRRITCTYVPCYSNLHVKTGEQNQKRTYFALETPGISNRGNSSTASTLLFEIPGVSNAATVRFWFCFYVQIRTAWHVRASSPAPDLVSRVVPLKVTRLSSLVPRRSPVVSWINAKDMTQTKGRIRYPSRRQ